MMNCAEALPYLLRVWSCTLEFVKLLLAALPWRPSAPGKNICSGKEGSSWIPLLTESLKLYVVLRWEGFSCFILFYCDFLRVKIAVLQLSNSLFFFFFFFLLNSFISPTQV